MKVRATKLGFMFNKRIYPGEVFSIDEKLFSAKWMAKVEDAKPEAAPAKQEAKAKKGGKIAADLEVI